ncbi:MAG TPA: hypothetical protein VFP39_17305, partial [Gemmatimonadales bacterium]|nr:hypothetical protein [Gemmatimonadales bacterium]
MRAGKSRFWRRVSRQLSLALCLAISLIAMALGPASAMAAVKWQVQTSWGPTAVAPGGEAQFALFVKNIGDSTSNGVITVVDRLPQGMSATGFEPTEPADSGWSCSGTTVVVCTTLRQVTPYLDRASAEGPNLRRVFIDATAKANASGTKENIATVSGGGAPVATTQARSVTYSTEPVGFGIIPDSFDSGVFDAAYPDGEPEQQAGTHPYEMRVDFETNERYGLAPNS